MVFSGTDDSSTMMNVPRNRLLLEEEQKMVDIKEPHHNDVLCGRGVTTNRHPGNESFRSLVGLNKEVYVSSTKKQKMAISRSIVEAVRSLDPPGRFLEKNPDSGLWSDIGHKKAVEKTSQALRDGAANLRKQLSADLGDPEFLNVVFDMDVDEDVTKSISIPTSQQRASKGKAIEKAKEKGKENKSRSSDKSKASKTKPTVAKKGHRRVNSNPNSGSTSSAKYFRRERICESPISAFSRPPDKTPDVARSACSTPVRKPPSHPRSPMTGSGRASYSDGHIPRVAYGHHSPQRHQYYASSRGQYPQRYHHGEYPHTPTEEWRENSYSGEFLYPHHLSTERMKYPLSAPARGHSSPPPPTLSFPPSGPLPPGRHHFSPAGYRSKPHPPDWSPRMMSRRQQQHSPRHHSAPQGSHSWTPSEHAHDTYVLRRGYSSGINDTSSSSLSVPSLGGEGSRSQSTRVLLAPRSRRMYDQTHPRAPPSDLAPDFAPPPRSPRFSREITSCREQEPKDGDDQDHGDALMPSFRASQGSPSGEEKKMDDNKVSVVLAVVAKKKERGSRAGVSLKPRPCYSYTIGDEELAKGTSSADDSLMHEEEPEKKKLDCHKTEENPAVEDIVMSPIPFDREDPTTLMELPENILTLPISAFGPNDEPSVTSFAT